MNIELVSRKLEELSKSSFRSSFHLKEKDKAYLKEKGFETILSHAKDFIANRLASQNSLNDGSQTPMKGHPVFIAQHATATCCRSCLYKWHHISKNKELTNKEQKYIVSIIMAWLIKNMN